MTTLLAGAIAVGVAVLGIIWRMLSTAKKSGVDQQKAKEAVVREQELNKVKDAARADDAIRADDSLLDDPYNRYRTRPKGRS